MNIKAIFLTLTRNYRVKVIPKKISNSKRFTRFKNRHHIDSTDINTVMPFWPYYLDATNNHSNKKIDWGYKTDDNSTSEFSDDFSDID